MNKRILLFLAACSLTLFATGCAGPQFKEYAATLPRLGANEGRIWFYRPGEVGSAIRPTIYLNGQALGRSLPNSFFHIDRPAGIYQVVCTTEWDHRVAFNLAPQTNKFIRLHVVPGLASGHVVPRDTDPAVAREELQAFRLTH